MRGHRSHERVLVDLAAAELALAYELRELEVRLAAQIGRVTDKPSEAFALARALREVVVLDGTVSRRIQGSLGAAATLRAQRRLLKDSGK